MEVAARDPWIRLNAAERHRRAADAEVYEAVGELLASWPEDPSVPDAASELARQYGWSHHEASEWCRIASALRELPALNDAQARGRLSRGQLRWVTRFATPETDQAWAARTPRMSPAELRLECRRQARVRRAQATSDHAGRYLHKWWDEDRRNLSFEGQLSAEHGAAFEEALHDAARGLEEDKEAVDPPAARDADALMSLVTSSGGKPSRPTLVVHADVATLMDVHDGTRHLGEAALGIQLHADAIRRIGCMSKVRAAVERNGELIGLVSISRGPTEAQSDALWHRDRGCTFPGCGTRRFVDTHHIRHWADGGETTVDNLTLLCGKHHRMLHEGGWTIRGRPPDRLEFVDRWGRIRTREVPELPRAG